jgi:TRAP-type transport system periplasmic protein
MTTVSRVVVTLGLTGLLGIAFSAGALAQTQLKASHQWPGGKGDVRDEMVQIIAREVAAANVGLDIRIYPAASLFKPTQQWDAMVQGQLDISAFPLDYASGKHPQFSATLMPGLVKNHEHARRLNDSPFMDDIKQIIDEQGVMVLSDAWLAGGFASKGECVLEPANAQGKVMRAAGPAFEQMLAAAGASINSMPSSEIYTGLQTGVLDAVNTSSGSLRLLSHLRAGRLPDAARRRCALVLLMSKASFERLDEAQQKALLDAGQTAEDYFFEAAKGLDVELVAAFEKAGVTVQAMSQDQFDQWLDLARTSSYKVFADEVPGGDQLIEKALAVE